MGGGLALVAFALAVILSPPAKIQSPDWAPLVAATDKSASLIGKARLDPVSGTTEWAFTARFDQDDVSLSLALPKSDCHSQSSARGVAITTCVSRRTMPLDNAPSELRFEQLRAMTNGRIPIGLNPHRHPGPFAARWSMHRELTVKTAGDILLDASGRDTAILTLSGGGLGTPRTITVTGANPFVPIHDWRVLPSYTDRVLQSLERIAAKRAERHFWAVQLPIFLAIVVLILLASAYPLLGLPKSCSPQRQREST